MHKSYRKAMSWLLAAALLIPQGWQSLQTPAAYAAEASPKIGDAIVSHDFETDTAGWFKRGSETVTRSTTAAHNGQASLLAEGRTAAWNGPGYNLAATGKLEKDAVYEFSAFVKLKEGSAGSANVKFGVQQTGAASEYVNPGTAAVVTADGWVEVKGNYTYDPKAASLQVYLQSDSAAAAFYVDDFKVKLVAPLMMSDGFESGIGTWTGNGGTASVSDNVYNSGSHGLLVTGRTANYNGPSIDLTTVLEKGAKYEISGMLKLAQGEPASKLKFTMNQPGAGNAYFQIAELQEVTDSVWIELKGSYTYDEAATAAKLYFETDDAGKNVSFALDDFKIRMTQAASGTTPPANPGDSGGGTTQPIVWNFEDGTAMGWGARGPETVAVSQEAAKSGTYSIKASGRTNNWNGPSRDVKGLMAKNKTYIVSAFVKLASAPSSASTLRLSMENKAAGADTAYTQIASTSTSGTDWVELKGSFSYASDMETLKLYMESSNAADIFYVDDVKMMPQGAIQTDVLSLGEFYQPYFDIGAAVETSQLAGVTDDLLKYHYTSIVAENVMKPGSISPREGVFNWSGPDTIAKYATDHHMRLRFHTLLWHQQGAEWMLQDASGNYLTATPENKQLVLSRLEAYLRTVVARYKDVGSSWDVVNEVIDEGRPDGMRDSYWYRLTGLDFIRTAFRVTREVAGPEAMLYINDYSTHNPKKRDFLFDLVQNLKAEGVPIDGIGHQTHINITGPSIGQISDSIRKFGEAGYDNQLTELDISVYTNNVDTFQTVPEDLIIKQGHRYKELFDELKRLDEMGRTAQNPGGWISNVTLWGIADDHTWLHNRPVTRQDAPFPFDKQYQVKPAYWGMVDPSKLTIVKNTGTVSRGTPVIDGATEFMWNLTPAMKTEKIGTLEASLKTLWDESNLYVRAEVKDSTKAAGDQIELFVNDTGVKKVDIARGAAHTAETADGYIVEAGIPLTEAGIAGKQLSFDMRVTDSGADDGTEHGKNGTIVSWSDPRSMQEADTDGFGTLTFTADPVKTAKVPYGTPELDGEMDAIWANGQEQSTDVWVEGTSGSTAKFRTLWDEGHLYVYALVSDLLLSDASANEYEEDSVEIFVDQNNAKTSTYEGDDGQYRINFNNVRSASGHANANNFISVTKIVYDQAHSPVGYVVEAAIELDLISPKAQAAVGFDLQVNNDQEGDGQRNTVVNWADPSGQSYQNTSKLGVLELLSQPAAGGNTGGGGGSSSSATQISTKLEVKEGAVTLIPVVTTANGRASASLSDDILQQALGQSKPNTSGKKIIAIEIAEQEGADSYEIQLPVKRLNGTEPYALSVKTAKGTVELPSSMLANANLSDAQTVTLSISKGSLDGLSETLRTQIGSRPFVNLQLLVDGKVIAWNNPGSPVTVALPYKPADEELKSPDHLVVWYIDSEGTVTTVVNGRYDAERGAVIFQTSHFSEYAVTSETKTFGDLGSVPWARTSIEAMASRTVIQGTSDMSFSPQSSIKRADFLALLVRVLELQGTGEGRVQFTDVAPSDYFYETLKVASELGLVSGTSDNQFSPESELTRQDMMVLTVRAMEKAGRKLEMSGSLQAFRDEDSVAAYARESAIKLVNAGLIQGMDGEMAPHASLTRAQAAVIIYRIWNE